MALSTCWRLVAVDQTSVDDCYRLVQVTAWSLLVVTGQFLTFYCVLHRTAVTCSGVSYVARCFLLVSCGTSDTQQLRVCGKVVTVKSLPTAHPTHPHTRSSLRSRHYSIRQAQGSCCVRLARVWNTENSYHAPRLGDKLLTYLFGEQRWQLTYVHTYVLRSFWVSRKGKCRKKELAVHTVHILCTQRYYNNVAGLCTGARK